MSALPQTLPEAERLYETYLKERQGELGDEQLKVAKAGGLVNESAACGVDHFCGIRLIPDPHWPIRWGS